MGDLRRFGSRSARGWLVSLVATGAVMMLLALPGDIAAQSQPELMGPPGPMATTGFSVETSAEFEGKPVSSLDARHLGKKLTFNILVRRSGEINEKTRVRITQDLGEMCGSLLGLRNPDGSLNNENVEITSEQGRVGTEISVNDACAITILGDAKAVVGNRFHIKVRLNKSLIGKKVLRCKVKAEDVETPAVESSEAHFDLPVNIPIEVEKTVEFEGKAVTLVGKHHLGKHLIYKIVVRRGGEIDEKTRIRITHDLSGMCGSLLGLRKPDGSLNDENIAITADQGRAGIEVQVNDNCVITILGEAKVIIGNHFYIKVRLKPSLEPGTSGLPSKVIAHLENAPVPVADASDDLNLGVAGEAAVRPAEASVGNVVACADGMNAVVVSRDGHEVGRAVPSVPFQWVAVQGLGPGLYHAVSGAKSSPVTVVAGTDQSANWSCTPLLMPATAGVAAAPAQAPAALPRTGGPALPSDVLAAGGFALLGLGWLLRRRMVQATVPAPVKQR